MQPPTLILFICMLLIAIFGDLLELALGVIMIFGSVLIAVGFWLWLGNTGWWFAGPLIALNLAWTSAGVWLIRRPETLLPERDTQDAFRQNIRPKQATILTRHGHSESITSPDSAWIKHRLLDELRTEQLDEPDDEHTRVSVSNGRGSVSVQVNGLMRFDNLDLLEGQASDLPATMYLRDITDAEVISIWQAVVRGDRAALLDHPWARCLETLTICEADDDRSA